MAAGQLPLSLVPSIENRDLSRQPGASSTTPFLSRFGFITVLVVFVLSTLCHSSNGPSIVLGQALMRLLQFSSALAAEDQNSQRLRHSHWTSFVEEFFLTSAILKLTLWKDNLKIEAKVFEIGTPALPRFFLVTSQSGVKSMTLSLDGAHERIVAPNCALVQCVSATWTYRYNNGYTVALRGPISAYVFVIPNATQSGAPSESALNPTFSLKIGRIQFASNLYEKNVSVNAIRGSRLDANENLEVRNALDPPPTVSDADAPSQPLPLPPFLRAVQEDDSRDGENLG
ncbi:LIM-domain binding protein-domain-containing protein [Lactifluus volemus]|nr:LIM-domain binding protein-domain-containing protein [Lactifluus volemus]